MSFIFSRAHTDEAALRDEALKHLQGQPLDQLLDSKQIRKMTRQYGCDLSTMILYEALHQTEPNATFLHRLESFPNKAADSFPDIHLLIIPTMYYREHPELGGDGQLIQTVARVFGARIRVLETASLGSITQNAELLWEMLREIPDEKLWFFTISKGAADLKRVFLQHDDGTLMKRTHGWVNLAGTLGGTPLVGAGKKTPVNNLFIKTWLRMRGATPGMLDEMNDTHPYSQAPLTLPASVTTINVLGFPLFYHLRRPVDKTYRYLAETGPNDGYVLMEHALIQPGFVAPLWSADHYLRTPEFCRKLYQIMHYIAAEESHDN